MHSGIIHPIGIMVGKLNGAIPATIIGARKEKELSVSGNLPQAMD